MCGAVRYTVAEKPLAGARVVCRMHTLIGHSRGDARHQAVVIDSVEELFEIEIDHDVVAVGDVTLRLSPVI